MSLLDIIEKQAGANGFRAKDNIMDLLDFADLLEDIFGTPQTRSLRGEVGRAGVDTAGVIARLKRGEVLGAVTEVGEKLVGLTPEAQQKAIERMLDFFAK